MKKSKVGLCLPDRELTPRSGSGVIPIVVRDQVLEQLRKRQDIELVEGLSFKNTVIRDGKVYHNDFCLNSLDLFFWYANIGREWSSHDLEVLKTLALSIPVFGDPFKLEQGLDKYTAHLALQRAGVRVAETVLFNYDSLRSVQLIMDEWEVAVLKPRRGAWGMGVTFIDDFAVLRDMVEYIRDLVGHDPDGGYLIERYYPNKLDEWASVTMLHGEIMYGYHKRAKKIVSAGHGRQKVYDDHQVGGAVDLFPLTQPQILEAHRAQAALGMDIIGFDMIMHESGPIIIDENTMPGFYLDLFEQVGRDPAAELCKIIDNAIKDMRLQQKNGARSPTK